MRASKQSVVINTVDEPRLQAMAAELAGQVRTPLVVYLTGPLGAGKTSFARALIQALGYQHRVKSPTYSLMETYVVDGATVVHLDLYRINDPGEIEYLGLDDMPGDTLCLVEWPERGPGALPEADLIIEIQGSGGHRNLAFTAESEKAVTLMESVAWSVYPN